MARPSRFLPYFFVQQLLRGNAFILIWRLAMKLEDDQILAALCYLYLQAMVRNLSCASC